MGRTTANLPLRPGEHYERCPACATVFRTKRRTRFRCPSCHRIMHALGVPDGETGYHRRSIEGDPRTFRVYLRRPGEGETAPQVDGDVGLFLEDADAAPPAPDAPPSPPPHPGPPAPPSPSARTAAGDRERAGSRLGAVWRGSLGDLLRRG